MGFSRTLAVFMCVILAFLAFVSQDVVAARGLAEANGRAPKGVYRGWPYRPGQPYGTRLPAPEGGYGGGGHGGPPKTDMEAEPPAAPSPTLCAATDIHEEASSLMSSPLTVHNRRPSTPLHVDLDDAIILSSGSHLESSLDIDFIYYEAECRETGGVQVMKNQHLAFLSARKFTRGVGLKLLTSVEDDREILMMVLIEDSGGYTLVDVAGVVKLGTLVCLYF
ncbi:hypothetical protein ACQ4PT_061716 [Festuca glaucescens]